MEEGILPELEPTLAAPTDAPEERTPDLEATRAAPIDVDAPPMADVERIEAPIPGDAPTALPIAPVCRYCRTPAVPGERLCSRCGMRLPVIDAQLATAAPDLALLRTPPPPGEPARLAWLGHASFLVQLDGVSLLVDAALGPKLFGGVERNVPPGVAIRDLRIDRRRVDADVHGGPREVCRVEPERPGPAREPPVDLRDDHVAHPEVDRRVTDVDVPLLRRHAALPFDRARGPS